MKKLITACLSIVLLISAVGCSANTPSPIIGPTAVLTSDNLLEGLTPRVEHPEAELTDEQIQALEQLSFRLYQYSYENDKNTMISPVSIIYALAMCANGASGNTLAEMERVFGLSVQELNDTLYAYTQLTNSDDLTFANSVWFKDDEKFSVQENFLQALVDYYSADAYKSAFDQSTVDAINQWCSDKTDGMIDHLLDQIPVDAIMYLINAVCFESEWSTPFESFNTFEEDFLKADGIYEKVQMMHSTESIYLSDDMGCGFVKYYQGNYAFVGLRPNDGISVEDYLKHLDAAAWENMKNTSDSGRVYIALPQFESKFDTELSNVLMNMGMRDAFDEDRADFSAMGSYEDMNIVINRVLHKTYIKVDEKGTKAAAITAVEMAKCTSVGPTEIKEWTVYLDRSFVYMIIDTNTWTPVFIGNVNSVN